MLFNNFFTGGTTSTCWDMITLHNPQNIWGFPTQMLSPVHTQKLPCYGRRIYEIPKCRRNIRGIGPTIKDGIVALMLISDRIFAIASKCGTRADRVHTDFGCKRTRRCLRSGPQSHFGNCITTEFRRKFFHPLIEHIHNQSRCNRLGIIIQTWRRNLI